ncbi:MAG: fimbrillin family protein [Bacteroides sp.]|nr:fimbrillin family protein [Bacteroides sp.]
MKTYRHIRTYRPTAVIALLAAAMLSACDSTDSMDSTATAVAPQFTADISTAAATRAVGGTWNGDQIGVMVTDAPSSDMETTYTNVPYSTTSTGTSADFTATGDAIYFQNRTETVTFAAYAPYREDMTGSITVSDTRTANANDQESIDFLFASDAEGSVSDPDVTFAFGHIMSKLVLKFKVGDASLSFTGLTDATKTTYRLYGLSHSGTVDLTPGSTTFGTATADNNPADWDITSCNPTDGSDEVRTYELILFPQDLSSSGMIIFVTIDGQDYHTTVSPNLKAGEVTTYTFTLSQEKLNVEGCTINPWGTESGTGSASVATNVTDLSTVTSDLSITENSILTGTGKTAVTITISGSASDVIFNNATFADDTKM